jgi:UDP-N-acetylglucosamine 2-epimerase (non-hydrolysing)
LGLQLKPSDVAYLAVPCLTLRPSTENPITVAQGTNRVVADLANLNLEVARLLSTPKLWDGRSPERIAQILNQPNQAKKAAACAAAIAV